MKLYVGDGLLNTAINKLPFELHIPSYNFCGPGTKLRERLARGDVGVNGLDDACREHDIAYSQEKDITRRHAADNVLFKKAFDRFRSKDASFGERVAALGVAGAMKAKVKLGLGLTKTNNKTSKQCIRKLEKTKKFTETSLQNIQDCITILQETKSDRKKRIVKKKNKPKERKKREQQKKPQQHEKINMDVDDYSMKRKRKLDIIDDLDNFTVKSKKFKPSFSEDDNISLERRPTIKRRLSFDDDDNDIENTSKKTKLDDKEEESESDVDMQLVN